MANTDNPHGFNVYGKLLRARLYAIATNPTIGFYIGDMVTSANIGLACTQGRGDMLSVYGGAVIPATPADAYPLLGSALAYFNEDMFPVLCIPKLTLGDGTVAGYVLVADDPNQQFEAQEDGDTAIAAADVGLNFEIASVSLNLGNALTGVSTQEIDSSSHGTTSTMALRITEMAHPDQDTIGSAGCRWVCQVNPSAHFHGQGTAVA